MSNLSSKPEINIEEKDESNDQSGNKYIEIQEIKRGKVIGMIERVLFFFFVLTGNYTSIAFVLTAKGITRYKELDDKDFAEYVLIGTLLSSSFAIFCAYFVKSTLAQI